MCVCVCVYVCFVWGFLTTHPKHYIYGYMEEEEIYVNMVNDLLK